MVEGISLGIIYYRHSAHNLDSRKNGRRGAIKIVIIYYLASRRLVFTRERALHGGRGGGKQYPLSLGVIERRGRRIVGKRNFGWRGLEKLGWRKVLSFFKGDLVLVSIKCFFGFRLIRGLKKRSLNRERLFRFKYNNIIMI